MGLGRYAPRTVEPEQPTIESDQPPERTAHGWELNDTDSWEPVVPDTWDPPTDIDAERVEQDGAAGWTDAARTEQEWADAARGAPGEAVRAPYPDSTGADQPEGEPTQAPPSEVQGPNPARMALGLATMAAQRLRGGVPAGDGFVTGVGLLQETANGLRALGQRLFDPAASAAAHTARQAASMPVAGVPVRAALRSGERLAGLLGDAREQGRQAVTRSLSEAEHMLRDGLGFGLRWAGTRVLPHVVDSMSPRLAEQVVPRIVAGAVPAIREALRSVADPSSTTDDRASTADESRGRP